MIDADNVTGVALTPAERQRLRRQRQKAQQQAPTCQSCGCALVPGVGGSGARLAAGLCRTCWLQTPAGAEAEAVRRKAGELTDAARERKRRWAAEARRKAREAKKQG
jgi:hypothetical protein